MSKFVLVCVVGLFLGFMVLPAHGDHCRGKHADEPGCPGNDADGVPYHIDYDFFNALSATGEFEAVVECTNQYCEFDADGVVFDFHLPQSYLDLFSVEDLQACFGPDPTSVLAHAITFRSGHGITDWHAHVEASAGTTESEPANYTFHFGGTCPDSDCPSLPQEAGWMKIFQGELLYVDLPTRGKGKRAPGCTCAWEDCPEPDDWMILTLTED